MTALHVIDPSSHLDNITESCLLEYLDVFESNKQNRLPLRSEEIDCIELLALLVSSKASLALYSKLTEWHHNCIAGSVSTKRLSPRDSIIGVLATRYMYNNLYPQLRPCILPSNGLAVNVPVQSFLSAVFSLLTSTDLMITDNLIFSDPKDPSYVQPFEQYTHYDEIDSGTAYHSYYQNNLINKKNAVQIPIILFADGTVVDKSGRVKCEPFMFTLGIFKQHVRTKAYAWRNLGFIKDNTINNQIKTGTSFPIAPTMKHQPNSPEFVPTKHNDYHAQVRTILNDIKTVQGIKQGIKWQFTIDGCKLPQIYRLYFPIVFFIGDTIEHNKLCGLRGGFSAKYICRLCDVPREKLDVPSNAVSAFEQKEMKRLGKRIPSNLYTLTDTRVLLKKRVMDPLYTKDIGYYPCKHNILQELQFCDPLGFNIATPPEVLHAVLLCHGTRSLNAFSRLTKYTPSSMSIQSGRSKQSIQNTNNNDSNEEETNINKKNYYVFTGKYKELVEVEMKNIGLQLSRQSDPDRPRSHFPSGYLPAPNKIDDNTSGKKAAHELRGVLFTILCFLLSHNQRSDLEKNGSTTDCVIHSLV
jgi:hypothetical protein